MRRRGGAKAFVPKPPRRTQDGSHGLQPTSSPPRDLPDEEEMLAFPSIRHDAESKAQRSCARGCPRSRPPVALRSCARNAVHPRTGAGGRWIRCAVPVVSGYDGHVGWDQPGWCGSLQMARREWLPTNHEAHLGVTRAGFIGLPFEAVRVASRADLIPWRFDRWDVGGEGGRSSHPSSLLRPVAVRFVQWPLSVAHRLDCPLSPARLRIRSDPASSALVGGLLSLRSKDTCFGPSPFVSKVRFNPGMDDGRERDGGGWFHPGPKCCMYRRGYIRSAPGGIAPPSDRLKSVLLPGSSPHPSSQLAPPHGLDLRRPIFLDPLCGGVGEG